ncbi:hypothetical protein [Lacicoccus alkaliphilus]|uniref:Hemerythrin HHE cation binding domain-containing protein n=1 Tax=Lacicoccus alkaliphilus DSM 16010 TaxID=1123231 RepID=A0A1M7EKE7_9BACL|nr:hypothetical protein [Salinicoccus alkaliphilus]SHL92251.1 hypothetical protein SAMN02745189_01253 [Salinicoccus alkaliphilus DSM 16010]
MVGPALRKFDSHKAIHDAGLGGAKERIEGMRGLLEKKEYAHLAEEVDSFIEFVEGKIIVHADTEEEENGLYTVAVKNDPGLHDKVQHLIRDHDIMRIIAGKMKDEIRREDPDYQQLIDFANSVIIVNEIHSRDEEEALLEK